MKSSTWSGPSRRTSNGFSSASGAPKKSWTSITRCTTCRAWVWYPQESCPHDGGVLAWERASGRGTLFSWAVVQRPFLPAFAEMVPFVAALVALDDDPAVRLCGYVVDAPAGELVPDAPLDVVFRPLEFPTVPGRSVTVPMWRVRP